MPLTLDLGSRIEIVTMDPHCENITLSLYQRDSGFLIHSYSHKDGAAARVEFLHRAAAVLGGLAWDGGHLHFPCGTVHQTAIRRVFLESAKIPTGADLAPKALHVHDKKLNAEVTVVSLGDGRYQVTAPAGCDPTRVEANAAGLVKLAQLEVIAPDTVAFPCGQSHDALIGLLLPRALNVRAVLREEESALSRGLLVAPSAQK